MTVLIEIIVPGDPPESYYLAKEPLHHNDLGGTSRFWQPRVVNTGSVQLQLSKVYGGFVRINYGDLTLLPDALIWPPPLKIDLKFGFVQRNGQLDKVFESSARLSSVSPDQLQYKLYQPEYPEQLLDEPESGKEVVDDEDNPIENAVVPVYFGAEGSSAKNLHLPPKMKAQGGDLADQLRFFRCGVTYDANFKVYDDGVDITTNASNPSPSDNSFMLEPRPMGEVRIKGDSEHGSSLVDVFTWAAARMSLTLDTAKARNPSPSVSVFLDSQQNLVDFLDGLAASYAHMFTIENGKLTLIDMLAVETDWEINEHQYFNSNYSYNDPLKRLAAEWSFLTASKNEKGMPTYENRKMNQFVESDNHFGREEKVQIYHTENNAQVVRNELINIGKLLSKPNASLRLPFDYGLVVPGKKIVYTDKNLYQDTPVEIHARTIGYDFDGEEVSIQGEGSYLTLPEDPTVGMAYHHPEKALKGLARQKKYYTVSPFGPGEGDYGSIAEAVADLSSEGGASLFLKNGIHTLNEEVAFGADDWEIRGENKNKTIIRIDFSDDTKSAFKFDGTPAGGQILIKNLSFEEGSTTDYDSMVKVVNTSAQTQPAGGRVRIINCDFDYTLGNGADLYMKRVRVANCSFDTDGNSSASLHPLRTEAESTNKKINLAVINCDFYEGEGILHNATSGNLVVRDCEFEEQRDVAIKAFSRNGVISGNRIYMKAYTTLQTGKTSARKGIYCEFPGGTVSDNFISLDEGTTSVDWGFEPIDIKDTQGLGKGSVVSGNVIEMTVGWSDGHEYEGIEIFSDSSVVNNNSIDMKIHNDDANSEIFGIRIKSRHCTVSGNYMSIEKEASTKDVGVMLRESTGGQDKPIGNSVSGNTGKGWSTMASGNWATNNAFGNINIIE